MWLALALLAAVASAATTVTLKRTLAEGGTLATTVAFRAIAGAILLALVLATTGIPALSLGYWRVAALVIVPEIAGMLFLSLALDAGELSTVQPLFGLLPLFVTVGGALLLGEIPTLAALAGIGCVTAGIYLIGMRAGASALEPLRALGRSRASWYAIASALSWTLTTVLHKRGIDAVGALPWAVTLTLGSALVVALALPFAAARRGDSGAAARGGDRGRWRRLVALAGVLFSVQQVGLMRALGIAPAAYVTAITATSILIATLFAIVILRERTARRQRLAASALVTVGAALVALYG